MNKVKKFFNKIIKFAKREKMFMFFVGYSLFNGILVRTITVGNFYDIRPILFDLGFLLIIGAFSFLIKEKNRFKYYLVWSIITSGICLANAIYYHYYDSFVSISLLMTSLFILDMDVGVMQNVFHIYDFIYLLEIPAIIIYYNYLKKNNITMSYIRKSDFKLMWKKYVVSIIVILATGSILSSAPEWNRFLNLWNRVSVVKCFGVYMYQMDDLVQSLEPKLNNIFGHDNAYKEVTDYYNNNKVKKSANEYTDIFKDKNVIVIHFESLQSFVMNLSFDGREVLPNINKLASEGIFFSNFYPQVGVGTSSDSEFTFSTSLMPSSSGTVFVSYANNYYVSLQKLLKEQGYYTFSMHANNGDFWNRANMHKSLGYDKFYSKNYYEIDEVIGTFGLSDKSFFRQSVSMIKEIAANNEKFMGTLITLTSHVPWSDTDKMGEYNVGYLEDDVMGRYIKALHYSDEALGEFIDELDREGLLDNTVLVIYGDHDAKIGMDSYNLLYNYNNSTGKLLTSGDKGYVDVNKYKYALDKSTPYIIWTKDQKFNVKCDTPMGMIDSLPTLGNMLGVSSKYSLGTDIMSIKDGSNMVVFKGGSFLTDKYYYNSQNDEVYSIKNQMIIDIYDKEYIDVRKEKARQILEVSDDIISFDLLKEIVNKK